MRVQTVTVHSNSCLRLLSPLLLNAWGLVSSRKSVAHVELGYMHWPVAFLLKAFGMCTHVIMHMSAHILYIHTITLRSTQACTLGVGYMASVSHQCFYRYSTAILGICTTTLRFFFFSLLFGWHYTEQTVVFLWCSIAIFSTILTLQFKINKHKSWKNNRDKKGQTTL